MESINNFKIHLFDWLNNVTASKGFKCLLKIDFDYIFNISLILSSPIDQLYNNFKVKSKFFMIVDFDSHPNQGDFIFLKQKDDNTGLLASVYSVDIINETMKLVIFGKEGFLNILPTMVNYRQSYLVYDKYFSIGSIRFQNIPNYYEFMRNLKFVKIKEKSGYNFKMAPNIICEFKELDEIVLTLTGIELSEGLGDTTRNLSKLPTPGKFDDIFSWHKTGRAIDINQDLDWVIIYDKHGNDMFFKLYLEVVPDITNLPKYKSLIDQYGEILSKELFKTNEVHHNYWKLPSTASEINFINITSVLNQYGFKRIKAQSGWETEYNKREWWHYEKRDNLNFYEALLEIYNENEIIESMSSLTKNHRDRMISEGFPLDVLSKM